MAWTRFSQPFYMARCNSRVCHCTRDRRIPDAKQNLANDQYGSCKLVLSETDNKTSAYRCESPATSACSSDCGRSMCWLGHGDGPRLAEGIWQPRWAPAAASACPPHKDGWSGGDKYGCILEDSSRSYSYKTASAAGAIRCCSARRQETGLLLAALVPWKEKSRHPDRNGTGREALLHITHGCRRHYKRVSGWHGSHLFDRTSKLRRFKDGMASQKSVAKQQRSSGRNHRIWNRKFFTSTVKKRPRLHWSPTHPKIFPSPSHFA